MLYNYTPEEMYADNVGGFKIAFGEAADVECYRNYDGWNNHFHTDAIRDYKTWSELMETQNVKIGDWRLMDEEEYNSTLCCNCCNRFSDMYEPGDKVLVVIYFVDDDEKDE